MNVEHNCPTSDHERAADALEDNWSQEGEGRTYDGPPPNTQAEQYGAEHEVNNCAGH